MPPTEPQQPTQTTTQAAPTQVAAPINGTAPLARVEAPADEALAPVGGVSTITWTRARIELIKKEIVPAGCTDDEFSLFIERCKRAQLDPLMNEAFCVPRRTKVVTGQDDRGYDIERWVTKHVFQPAEAGMEARADRFPDFGGIRAACVYEKDTIKINPSAGEVEHSFDPTKPRGALIGAWAIAVRKGRVTPVAWIPLGDRIQTGKDGKPTSMWSKPDTMIKKCARAEALRIAYPNTFGGMHIAAELGEDDERELNAPPETNQQRENGGKSKTQTLEQKARERAAAGRPAGATTVDAPSGGVLSFGPVELKGKAIASLDNQQLVNMIALGEKGISEEPGAAWAGRVKANVAELKAEQSRRYEKARQAAGAVTSSEVANMPPPPVEEREPGADEGEPVEPDPFA